MAPDRTPTANGAALREQDSRLEAIYRDEAATLRGRLLAVARDPAVADDLVGEAFLRLATQIREGRAPDDPAAWLYRVGRNLAISRGRHQTVASRAMPGLLDRGVAELPEDEVIRRERVDLVQNALTILDRGDQELVLMAATGYRPTEIAGLTGRSKEATRTRLCRARGRLRAHLLSSGLVA